MSTARMLFNGLSIGRDDHHEQHEHQDKYCGRANNYEQIMFRETERQYMFPDNISQRFEFHNDDEGKHIFEIPLKMEFINALRSINIVDPIFNCMRPRSSYQVHIQFKSVLGISKLGTSRKDEIVGDVCATHELAEASAIIKALQFLRNVHNIILVDISSRKESVLIRCSRKLYRNVIRGLQIVDFIIKKWHKSLGMLDEVEKFAYPKTKHHNAGELKFAEQVYKAMQSIKRDSMLQISFYYTKLKCLCDEKDKYVEAIRQKQPFIPKVPIKKSYFHDVDALDLLLKWLNLENCQYSASLGDDGQFLGCVMLSFSCDQTMVPMGDVGIEAERPKTTIAKAHNAAAREAIYFLERHFNVDIAGCNHNFKVLAEKEMFTWKGLSEDTYLLGESVLNFWDDMLNKVGQSIRGIKATCSLHPSLPGAENELSLTNPIIGQLDLVAAKCNELFKLAEAKFGSLK